MIEGLYKVKLTFERPLSRLMVVIFAVGLFISSLALVESLWTSKGALTSALSLTLTEAVMAAVTAVAVMAAMVTSFERPVRSSV